MNPLLTLLMFYFSLVSSLSTSDSNAFQKFYTTTKGPQWTTQPPNQNDPCGWTVGTKISVVCVGDRITQLKIQSNNLAGTVPSNLKDLTQLTSLDLQGNVINGVFPKLTSTVLTSLNLKGNKFVGQIPDITSLTSLDYIDLSNNQFSSNVPSEYTTRSFDTLYLSTGNNLCPFGNYSTNAVNNDCPTTSTCIQCTNFTCAGRGSCSALSTSYYCFCTAGYYDDNCQTTYSTLQCNWDDCQSGYCNSATGNCVCATGFAGIDCEPDSVIGGGDLCTPNPCKHGGTCTSFSFTSDFQCNCPSDYTGHLCEENGNGCGSSDCLHNQAVGIGVGVTFGLLALVALILLTLFFLRRKKIQKKKGIEYPQTDDIESIPTKTIIGGDTTLINTKFEISVPGFMNIDFVNQIRKEEKIGGGGAAIIYKGAIVDPNLREKFGFKEVAIKQIVDDQNISLEENRLRFEQEVSINWAISSHPNIITLVGFSENPLSIITKLYDEDLHHYIKNSKENISSEIILKIAKEIASGMNLVHSTRIAHRDLKPSNILLEKENGQMRAIICDFGLARISSDKNKFVNVKGFSPRYTAPEVFGRMSANVSTGIMIEDEMKSDVYSYSLILWEMMTRKIPWSSSKEAAEIDFQIRSGKREPIPDAKGDKILELLTATIELSWRQIPSERPTFQQIEQKLSPIT